MAPAPSTPTVPASAKQASGFGLSHDILVRVAFFAVESFFSDIKVVGKENMPMTGGTLLACSHLNMAVDPACLSYAVHAAAKGRLKRFIHYWVKDSLFKNPAVGALLLNAGNIPVDRKTKNNQVLFRGTFEALDRGEVVGIFPEGTSHTNSRLMPIKDGVSWTALEYLTYLSEHKGTVSLGGSTTNAHKPASIVPVGLTYSDKSKYRSRVVMEFGKPITMDAYVDEFLSGEEGAAKSAVKRLTAKVEEEMTKLTVNAEDWDTMHAAVMARELLWEDETDLRMENFVEVSQTLVDLFTNPDPSSPISALKKTLLTYHSYLTTARLTNASLSQIPLPATLDPSRPIPVPTRFSTLWILTRDILSSLIRLPFFALPFVINIPIYFMARMGARLAQDEDETQAQMKMFFGVAFSILVYPFIALGLYAVVFRSGIFGGLVGLTLAGTFVWGLVMYHLSLIDDNYEHFRKLVAAFRILIGIWSPRSWDVTLPPATLSRASSFASTSPSTSSHNGPLPPHHPTPPSPSSTMASFPAKKKAGGEPSKPHIPSRRLIRQVLRSRLRSSKALEVFLLSLESSSETTKVRSSIWMATIPPAPEDAHFLLGQGIYPPGASGPEDDRPLATGWRDGKEVVEFLRERGARIQSGGMAEREGMHWLEELGADPRKMD